MMTASNDGMLHCIKNLHYYGITLPLLLPLGPTIINVVIFCAIRDCMISREVQKMSTKISLKHSKSSDFHDSMDLMFH